MKRKSGIVTVMVLVLTLIFCLGTAQAAVQEKNASVEKSFERAVDSSLKEVGADGCLVSFTRKHLVDNIYEYYITLKVGAGKYDKIGVHRVIKERAPWVPISTSKAVMLIPGDSCNFTNAYMAPTANKSFGIFLAENSVDVWGIDLRWNFVPDTTTDFSFMKNWDTSRHLKDIKVAVKLSRTMRGLTGSGFGKITMLGHSRGAQFLYAYANEETQLPKICRDLKGIIPVDMAYKISPDNQELQQEALLRYQVFKSLHDSGVYYSEEGKNMKGIAYLAQSAPDDQSPLIPGLTNMQAALFALTATHATYEAPLQPPTPFYHYLSGIFDSNGIPTGLQFANIDNIITNAFAAPDFQSLGEMIDGEAIMSGSIETPYDDHLGDITIPVYYVGAAGGFGEYGTYTLTLLGSTDKDSLIVQMYPPEAAALDFGHADLFWSDNAKTLAWEPICKWIKTH
ncbi:MAG: hypothetical protein PHX16_08490 [Syntrophaceticus sp.]|nr:hypothetical protein [Syntrophaceticus sp.]MDD3314800.1 hypothetical protein [Syntrophaceticus sp.]MDD4783646.1 hypothetical protein [Syntrophaceticus sp.]